MGSYFGFVLSGLIVAARLLSEVIWVVSDTTNESDTDPHPDTADGCHPSVLGQSFPEQLRNSRIVLDAESSGEKPCTSVARF